MPRVELQDAFGTSYSITTRSRELLQSWFDEWLPLTYPADAPSEIGDPVIRAVYPLDVTGEGYDWPLCAQFMSDSFRIPRNPAKALEALDERRAWIEAQQHA
jgi:hypothetical protein